MEWEKAKYATYNSGEAKRWWHADRDILAFELGSAKAITWAWFNEQFFNQYFPKVRQEANAQEFMNFVQGSMIMDQFVVNFTELSFFAQYLISYEEKNTRSLRGVSIREFNIELPASKSRTL
jgi:flagellar basal body-associated protein FliL